MPVINLTSGQSATINSINHLLRERKDAREAIRVSSNALIEMLTDSTSIYLPELDEIIYAYAATACHFYDRELDADRQISELRRKVENEERMTFNHLTATAYAPSHQVLSF